MIVQEYIRADGGNPFHDWFDSLDPQAAAKVTTGLLRLELGNISNVKWIGGGLGEYRIDWGPGYRLYLMRDGEELIILFAGGTKRRQSRRTSREQGCSRTNTGRARQRRKGDDMTMTRDFKETVKERAGRDPAFAKALLDEAATLFLNGEPHTARLILRDLVNASLGFETLAAETRRPSKSLHPDAFGKG